MTSCPRQRDGALPSAWRNCFLDEDERVAVLLMTVSRTYGLKLGHPERDVFEVLGIFRHKKHSVRSQTRSIKSEDHGDLLMTDRHRLNSMGHSYG